MEILTLVKANIRHKKGAFFGIAILMTILSMSLTAILSVRENCTVSVENAYEASGAGDLIVNIADKRFTDELKTAVETNPLVDHTEIYTAVQSNKASVNDNENTNNWMLLKMHDGIRLYNDALDGYETQIPPLKQGEVYITQGIQTTLECSVNDKITISTISGDYEFLIKGIVVEPVFGAFPIGWKQVFISDEDFEEMLAAATAAETDDATGVVRVCNIFQADSSDLSLGEFRRQLNLDTGILDNAFGSLTRDMSMHYTLLFPNIITSVLVVFIGMLLVIVLIVMGHNISAGIEMDYGNLGILKSQGFHTGKIRLVYLLQYLLAEITGSVIGVILSLLIIRPLGNVFQPITGILAESSVQLGESLLILSGLLVVSVFFVLVLTRKIGRISPMRALSGFKNEIYFDSRIKAPVSGRFLLSSLALRQFTSCKRRYASAFLVVSILVFFMSTITLLGNALNSKSALESMGAISTEVGVDFKETPDDTLLHEMEQVVEQYSPILQKYYMNHLYVSLEGEELYCLIYQDPDAIVTTRGRAPLYDNEIVITEIIAEEFGIGIGDTVTVSYHSEKHDYLISGIFQSINDAGRVFAMSLDGGKQLGITTIFDAGYSLKNRDQCVEIAEALNKAFPEKIEAKSYEYETFLGETVNIAIDAMKLVIYSFSILFALVVVVMVCSRAFIQEKTDIGIYKALGFTSPKLRLQFAVRFLIVAAIGSVSGTLLSVLFSGRLLSTLLRSMGITRFIVNFTPFTLLLPIVLICICFFAFAFLASRKIRKVEVKNLIAE